MAAYVAYDKKSDKKKAINNLEVVADLLDKWYPGNLRFVRDGHIGTLLKNIQTNFRFGTLPRVKDAKKGADLREILVSIENMERVLEQTTAIGQDNLEIWSGMLSRYPTGATPIRFWRKLPTKKIHLLKGLITAATTAATAIIGLVYVNAEAAFLGAISIFSLMVLIIISTREKQKGS